LRPLTESLQPTALPGPATSSGRLY